MTNKRPTKKAPAEAGASDPFEEDHFVALPDGRHVPAIRMELGPKEHTPEHLIEWIEREDVQRNWPPRVLAFKRRLCVDERMSDFWSWIGTVRFSSFDRFRSSGTVSENILRSTRLPGKPGNMTPTQREAYFKKVRVHVEALSKLLEGTKFDSPWVTELTEQELERSLSEHLYSWGEDESDEGHVVAYQVTTEGRYRQHYEYPDNVLRETLHNVHEWTYWDDNWDGNIFGTSAPIAQANSHSTPIVYFCCTFYEWFHRYGVEIPFGILATVANVALDLPADKQIDEDVARKQVRRFQQRRAKALAEQDSKPIPF